MDVKIGGAALAIILVGLAIAFGVTECQRGPLDPEVVDGTSDEQKAWLTLEHRIKRADPAFTEVTHDGQTLSILYQPDKAADDDEAWPPRLLRIVGQGLAAVNSAPGGKQYTQVTINAQIITPNDVELIYAMVDFDAIKTQQDGYTTFASMPRVLRFSSASLAQARDYCRGPSALGFYPEFCQRVSTAKARQLLQ
ncbi:hypothetical protein [Pseudomonas gingeri]|uniref:Uncharacterized protein n=1 Tax=Pseudomonas gingeri TaxID=117681 RepID=A0A7Y7Y6R2_9PSED|nr:hypothetical protein [Pseudomonas gingeri]NWB29936.1 hypothetical protein [Pseudomonas gingeri]NWC30836.1 hypothetical protein [Pseudomonas gingeri]NWD09510.1 hypothetical protein [Pseudomonas gingeri]NWD50475.1 hypothetical protein [Pseudomonas gingeri]NWE34304.1 hypothetical protein [Pseudomonas gingeri]